MKIQDKGLIGTLGVLAVAGSLAIGVPLIRDIRETRKLESYVSQTAIPARQFKTYWGVAEYFKEKNPQFKDTDIRTLVEIIRKDNGYQEISSIGKLKLREYKTE